MDGTCEMQCWDLLLDMYFAPIVGAAPWASTDPERNIDMRPPFPPPKTFIRKRRPYRAIIF